MKLEDTSVALMQRYRYSRGNDLNIRTPAIIGRSYTETKLHRYSVMPQKGRRSPPYTATEKWSSSVNPRLR